VETIWEQQKMIGIEEPQEMTMEARRRELASLLAKGFLRFRKRVDYNEIIRRCATEGTSLASEAQLHLSSQNDLISPAQPSVHCDSN